MLITDDGVGAAAAGQERLLTAVDGRAVPATTAGEPGVRTDFMNGPPPPAAARTARRSAVGGVRRGSSRSGDRCVAGASTRMGAAAARPGERLTSDRARGRRSAGRSAGERICRKSGPTSQNPR
ncbi:MULTISPECIES: hypothetical protein [unclassified Nonomuraea]|uniref:hypothetical protein n=1 Tax=unclassified Nonomuraea TaxID=2593643 RepID=UPI0033E3EC20